MKSYFFNAEPTADLVEHPTGYDREYDADDHAAFFQPFFIQAGVFAGADADACKVTVLDGATLQVSAGAVYARGRMAVFDGTETIRVAEDCHIVARMNKSADVRAFQLLAVAEPVQTEDICDVPLASAALSAVIGGYEVALTDTRTFMAFTGQPPYYPPSSDNLPYVLWLYALGFPMTPDQRAAVEGNPDLMGIFSASLGAARSATVTFTEASWSGSPGAYAMAISRADHGRSGPNFGYTIWHLISGAYIRNTWAVMGTALRYDAANAGVVLESADNFPGKITFMG